MYTHLNLCPRLQLKQPIYVEEIVLLEGIGNYTMVYLRDGKKILTSKTLKLFSQLVSTDMFWRVNKTHIICASEIKTWQIIAHSMCLTLSNGLVCHVSRRRKTWIFLHLKQTLSVTQSIYY